ncbi:MAG: AAA family ATPase, partial [Burkholderiaceae bacterium]
SARESNLRTEEALMFRVSKIASHARFEHLAVPADRLSQLRIVATQRTGTVLLTGPSGTGKTLAAEALASTMGRDLMRIDLGRVVSRFIGETEKNLDRLFAIASVSEAVLFFDEADALFGKRSDVRDSHDRYANVEVGYLLQKIESYRGLIILASNARHNIDPAFLRRLRYVVDLPWPPKRT